MMIRFKLIIEFKLTNKYTNDFRLEIEDNLYVFMEFCFLP